jgi:phosphate/sulfate permease
MFSLIFLIALIALVLSAIHCMLAPSDKAPRVRVFFSFIGGVFGLGLAVAFNEWIRWWDSWWQMFSEQSSL